MVAYAFPVRYRYNTETRTLEEIPVNNPNITVGNTAIGTAATAQPVAQANPEQPRDVIGVIVRRDNYGTWYIAVNRNGSNLPLPDINVIKSLLPPEWKRLLGGRHSSRRRVSYYLTQALDSGLPTQVLHDTLQAWAFTYIRSSEPVESTSPVRPNEDEAFLLKAQPATIFVGGKSFKLVPTSERNNTNIYKHIRDKAKAVAQIEVQAKLDKAHTDARILVNEATDRANRLRLEMDQLRASLGNQAPEWARLTGRPLKLMSSRWYVALRVPTYIEDIRYRVDRWHATLHWNPVHNYAEDYYQSRPMTLWLLLNPEGGYNMSSIVSDIWYTVHTSSRACMEIQGLPTRIRNGDDLINLERGIARGIRVINFNSPLNMELSRFYPLFAEQLPEMVKKLILGNASWPQPDATTTPADYLARSNEGRTANNPRISWDRIETDATELQYIFQVRDEVRNAG